MGVEGIRLEREKWEDEYLHPRAARAAKSKGRAREEEHCPIRTVFQRDRDRIIHSKSFRRLKHKTQVFISPLGDHYRTRLTHTLEVTQIARSLSRALKLNEDLTEAIALGHDLGHTPFGHTGEEILDELFPGGFSHSAQSLRVIDLLEMDGKGLNLTAEVREGIYNHSKGMKPLKDIESDSAKISLESQVMRISDIIGYVNHDLDDAIRAGLISREQIPRDIRNVLGDTNSSRIDTLVRDVINSSLENNLEFIHLSKEKSETLDALREFLNENVYTHPVIKREADKAARIIRQLISYYLENPEKISRYNFDTDDSEKARLIIDIIAGMTDRYAIQFFTDLFIPKPAEA
ncbi:MAG: deoxyguanosinetriphosphate triphosphohydrolase [Acidobacteria bacterium]|nr:deoxyguanosinetriphosphate triphosphohydrolase [Acidobacteriota bacterium]